MKNYSNSISKFTFKILDYYKIFINDHNNNLRHIKLP